MNKLEGSVALVTGSGRGIGAATALMLAKEGASVMVNDRDRDACEESVAAIHEAGGRAEFLDLDLTLDTTS